MIAGLLRVVLALPFILFSDAFGSAAASTAGVVLNCWELYHKYELREHPTNSARSLPDWPFDNDRVLDYVRQYAALQPDQEPALKAVREWKVEFFEAIEIQQTKRLPVVHIRSTISGDLQRLIKSYRPFSLETCEVRAHLNSPVPHPHGTYLELNSAGGGRLSLCIFDRKLYTRANFSVRQRSDITARKDASDRHCSFALGSTHYPPDIAVNRSFLDTVLAIFGPLPPLDFATDFGAWLKGVRWPISIKVPSVEKASTALRALVESNVRNITIEISDEKIGFRSSDDVPQVFLSTAMFRAPGDMQEFGYGLFINLFECLKQLKSGVESTYVVQPGDSLWRIAKKQYGFGQYQHAIANRNGILLSKAGSLEPGRVLTLPSGCIQQTGDTILVERGDTLWKILEKRGALDELDRVVRLNPQLVNPGHIYPSQMIRVR